MHDKREIISTYSMKDSHTAKMRKDVNNKLKYIYIYNAD